MAAAATSITVIVNGESRTMPIERVRERFVELAREVMGADAEHQAAADRHLKRQVAFGAFIIQVQPHIPEGTFLRWLGEANFGHFQKVYAAIGLAEKYAAADGHLDEAKLDAAIDRYNAKAASIGYRPLPHSSRSVRSAQVAGEMRRGTPLVRNAAGSGAPEPGNRGGGGYMVGGQEMDQREVEEFVCGLAPARSIAAGAGAGFASPAASVPPHTLGRTTEMSFSPGSGEAIERRAQAPAGAVAGASHGSSGRVLRALPKGRDFPGQYTLEEEYAAVAGIARDVARCLDAHAVEPALMARFKELAEEVLAAAPGRWESGSGEPDHQQQRKGGA